MHILVTGGAGYIGSVLVPLLIERGHRVRVVDLGWFGLHKNLKDPPGIVHVIQGDILDFKEWWLDDIDAVIHLAGLSNDPMAQFDPKLNYTTNAVGTALVAHAAKDHGIRRFVYASSCSVYGLCTELANEYGTIPHPSFPYAISKLMGERALECLEDSQFRPISLRKGTVVGYSPRMRFDLATNTMAKAALTSNVITVHNPDIWRPIVDVRDAAMAYALAVESSLQLTGAFNIAEGNYRIGVLATIVQQILQSRGQDAGLKTLYQLDLRNYRVDTTRANHHLGFRPEYSVQDSIIEVLEHLPTDLENPIYTNVVWLEQLEASRKL